MPDDISESLKKLEKQRKEEQLREDLKRIYSECEISKHPDEELITDCLVYGRIPASECSSCNVEKCGHNPNNLLYIWKSLREQKR
jgi:hypothetical protein